MSEPTPPATAGRFEDGAVRPGRPGEVRLPSFRGTLEMLLHLIRTEEIDVTTLPVAEIARQCRDDLAAGPAVEPDAVGDHVVGVATLIHVKSRRLLPPDPEAAAPLEAATPLEAARVERAASEAALRNVMEHLQEREALMELVYFRPDAAVADYAGEEGIDADVFALLKAFREILRRAGEDGETGSIERERITLVERIHWLMETMQRERRLHFRALFDDLPDRVACILTFLALLEVIRLRLVRAQVSHHQEDILIVLAEEEGHA